MVCNCKNGTGACENSAAHDVAVSEGRFFYVDEESGKTVFTELYLRRRGYCCGTGCRHCPYENDASSDKAMSPLGGTNER